MKKDLSNDKLAITITYLMIVVPIILSIILTYQDFLDGHRFCLNKENLENFLAIYDFPIKFFAAGLFVLGSRAIWIRSAQSAHQLKLITENNIFNNYFSHRKSFFELLESFESKGLVTFISKQSTYVLFFPNNSPCHVEYVADSENLENHFSKFKNWLNEAHKIECDDDHTEYKKVSDLFNRLEKILRGLEIRVAKTLGESWLLKNIEGIDVSNIPVDIKETLNQLADIHDSLAVFSGLKSSVLNDGYRIPDCLWLEEVKYEIKRAMENP